MDIGRIHFMVHKLLSSELLSNIHAKPSFSTLFYCCGTPLFHSFDILNSFLRIYRTRGTQLDLPKISVNTKIQWHVTVSLAIY